MALTASFTDYPTGVTSPNFTVTLEFSRAILPTSLVGTDFRLRRLDGVFNNPSLDDVTFQTDDNITFVCIFNVSGPIVADAQYLVRLPANRVQYLDDDSNSQSGPDSTINTPQFSIEDLRVISGSITFSETQGEVGTAVTATLTVNQEITGVGISDFSVVNGTLGNEVTVVSETEYTVQVTPTTGDGTMTVTFAEDGAYETNPAITADLSYTDSGTPALSFGTETIANQAWVVGDDDTITLPEATGGTGTIVYTLTPTLPTGATFTAATRVLAYNPTGRFSVDTFTYTATDGNSDTVTLTFTIVVTAPAIVIPSISNKVWTVGTAVSFTLPVATGGVGAFTYSLSPALPAGVTRNVRLVSGNPTTAVTVATYTYTAEDSEGETETGTFTIIVNAAAVPITFATTVENQIWDIDEAIDTLTLPTATGGDGTFTYALTPALPMGISRTAFEVDGTPTEASNQAFYTWTATDGNGDTGNTQFTIRVRAASTERDTNPYTYPNETDVSILPSNRTDFELAIEDTMRYNVLPIVDGHKHNPIIDVWNDEKVLYEHIVCLGINLGLEIDTRLTEAQQRELLKCAWNLHSFSGTPHVILEIVRALGYPGVSIDEGVNSHWANFEVVITSEHLSIIDGEAILKLIRDLKPVRSVLVGIDVTASTENWDGALDFNGTHTFGTIVDSGLV